MNEEDTIKRRLTFDGEGTGDDRRLNQIIKLTSKLVHCPKNQRNESKQLYDKILCQISATEYSRRKANLVKRKNKKQLEKFKGCIKVMELEITRIKSSIQNSSELLADTQILKHNKIEYDMLAKNIQKEMDRNELIKEIGELKLDLEKLRKCDMELTEQLNLQRKQFGVLIHSADKLQTIFMKMAEINQIDDLLNTNNN